MASQRKISNLLALSLLNLLVERPMYPYEMAATLRHRGKDQSIKINWGSLYTVVQNLEKYGFIEAVDVAREGRQPERTTYLITDAGREELKDWLRELIGEPEREYTRFEAALGECAVLPPNELTGLLQRPLDAMEATIVQHEAEGLHDGQFQAPLERERPRVANRHAGHFRNVDLACHASQRWDALEQGDEQGDHQYAGNDRRRDRHG